MILFFLVVFVLLNIKFLLLLMMLVNYNVKLVSKMMRIL